jgi:hypothetical protein
MNDEQALELIHRIIEIGKEAGDLCLSPTGPHTADSGLVLHLGRCWGMSERTLEDYKRRKKEDCR